MPHLRLAYLLPPDLEDPFVADLFAAGTLGVQSVAQADGRLLLSAWFPEGAEPEIEDGWRERGIEAAGREVEPDTDWLALYRERAQPFAVGRTLFVDPREPNPEDAPPPDVPPGRRLLRLPARGAFGTGSHESTRLVLELLEEMDLVGRRVRRVLDVGSGTGVLAFAALLCGARAAVGFDVDLAAPFHGLENRRLNRLAGGEPAFFAGSVAALRSLPIFDLALVNVVPEQILPDLPAIVRLLRPGGEAILSGILKERGRQVLERAAGLGLAETARKEAGDWVAFRISL